jgi:hypothetical protein
VPLVRNLSLFVTIPALWVKGDHFSTGKDVKSECFILYLAKLNNEKT